MKYFKIKPDHHAEQYEITGENFENITDHAFPFEQEFEKNEVRQYAICPACLNPIQIIGIAHKTKVRPYGKHAGENIAGLPKWNQNRYEYCPYASHKRSPSDDDKTIIIDEQTVELYNILKEQFDNVAHIISNVLSMHPSKNFWEDAIERYLNCYGYAYPWLTEFNLPYIFMYRGFQCANPIGQKFKKDSLLYESLAKRPDTKFIKTDNDSYERLKNKEGCFLQLSFRFTGHIQSMNDEQSLNEYAEFYVDDRNDPDYPNNPVYHERINFDQFLFYNMIRSERKRGEWLLNIAEEKMKPIQKTE